jgi:PAS domain S-box-containing protein
MAQFDKQPDHLLDFGHNSPVWRKLASKGTPSLSVRMLSYILLCSTVLALLITIFQLAWDYRKDVSEIEANISQIKVSFLQPIAASLWNLDEEQVQVQIEGIMNLPNMQYVLIKEMLGEGQVPLLARGEAQQHYDIEHEFELNYQGEVVGRLFVAASLEQVYRRLWEKAMVILISQTLKTLLVSICILFIIYHLIIKHISTIVDYTRRLDLDNLGAPLKLDRKTRKHSDELEELVNTFNQMREKIQQEFDAKLKATEQLAQERDFSATIINASNAVIACLNTELQIESTNPAGVMLTGHSQKELEGENWLSVFVDKESRERVETPLRELRLLQDQELTLEDLNGQKSTLLWSFVPFYEGNKVSRLIAFGYDVTALKKVEFEILTLNEQLEQKVTYRTQKLEESNQQLAAAFKQLQSTQDSLVEAEKMASLGGLVAGVAHEINTPIGISVTAASYMQEQSHQLNQKMNGGKLTKSFMESFIHNVDESTELLLNNLKRASDLISSFKQVAVDQSSEACYTFNLNENINQVVTSLGHKLKRAKCEVEIDCAPELELNSYPGSFTQIYSNLILNSINHGFEEWEGERLIKIDIHQKDNSLVINYHDTGRGVEPEVAKRIFDPFVTTKRGRGGSGLGTHIVYNLVVQLLKGRIHFNTELNKGVNFIIELPYTGPATEQNVVA